VIFSKCLENSENLPGKVLEVADYESGLTFMYLRRCCGGWLVNALSRAQLLVDWAVVLTDGWHLKAKQIY